MKVYICFTVFRSLFTTDFLIFDMPTAITPEQKQELLRRLELARAAKAAKQEEKVKAQPPASKSAKSAISKASKASTLTAVQPQPVQKPEPTSQLAAPPVQEAAQSSATTKEPEVASCKTATETSSQSQQPETPSKSKKKVCLPVDSDTDSEEEEKPKKRGRKPYATIVLHREPKKSIDKVINRLARIESSDSETSEDDEPTKPSEPIPIPPPKSARPVPKQTQSIHNQDTARREMLKKLAMEYYG